MSARHDAKAAYEAAVRERDWLAALLAEAEREVESAYHALEQVWVDLLADTP